MSKGNKKDVRSQAQDQHPEFVEEVANLTAEQMEGRLAQLAKDTEAVSDAKEADEQLEQALAQANELAGPYRDAKKAIRLKSRYLIALLKDKA